MRTSHEESSRDPHVSARILQFISLIVSVVLRRARATSEPPSILSRLRSPALSDLSRKRKVDANRVPPLGKKRASSQALNATYVRKSVKPAQRALEFPGEHLVESVGSLFCRACRECLCVKRSVVKNAFPSNPSLQSQWAAYGISCDQPGIDCFHKRLGDDQSNPMKAFKAARFLSPFKMNEIQPMAMDIDDLRAFPFLVGDISGLKTELPTYLAQAADVSTGVDTLRWWKDHSEDLPCWSSAAKKVFLLQ